MSPTALRALIILMVMGACRPKPKPNILSLVPETVPAVAWIPNPETGLAEVNAFLSTFDGSTLGTQLKALRSDLQRQFGVDPLDPKSFQPLGLDVSQPWGVASDEHGGLVFLLAATAPETFLTHFKKTMAETQLIDKPEQRGPVIVFSQPFGHVQLEQAAVRLADKAVLLTFGDGGAQRLAAWPVNEPQNFQKFWKRAGPDGSLPGAALRMYARDTAKLLPPSLVEALGPKAELRSALTVTAHRAELFTTVLGVPQERLQDLLIENTSDQPSVGFSDKSVLWARSTLQSSKMLRLLRELKVFSPLVGNIDATLGAGALDTLMQLGTGEAALGIECDPSQLKGGDRLRALLDAFPITATAKLTGDLDAQLTGLQEKLRARGIPAAIEAGTPPKLRASTLSPQSQATLSHRGDTLLYAVGPGAFDRLQERLLRKEGLHKAAFTPLLEAQTSGVIVDLGSLLENAPALTKLLLGEQAMGVVRSVLSRTLDSLSHFETLGLTLQFEGFAMGPHPVLRMWLTTK